MHCSSTVALEISHENIYSVYSVYTIILVVKLVSFRNATISFRVLCIVHFKMFALQQQRASRPQRKHHQNS